MDNIILQLKQSIRFFIKYKILILPFLLLIFFLFLCYLHPPLLFFFNIKPINNYNNNLKTPRKLESIFKSKNMSNENDNDNDNDNDDFFFNDVNFTLIEGMNTNLTEILLYYEFIDSISHTYYGDWEDLYLKKNKFKYKKGNSDIDFYEEGKENFLFNLKQKNCSNLSAYFSLKDGIYEDNYIEGNFTFNFQNFSLPENLEKDSFSIIIPNTSLSYAFGEYIDLSKKKTLNNTFINITFYKELKMFYNKMRYELSSTDYSRVSLYILSQSIKRNNDTVNNSNNSIIDNNTIAEEYVKEFEVYFEAEAHGSYSYPEKILNYSIFFSLFAYIEIIYTTKFLILVSENHQMSLNTDIYTIIIQIMWCSIICCGNFFLALSQYNLLFEYGMPTVLYFCLFSIFLLRILFFAWRARNVDLIYRDMRLFKKKLIRFYLSFYCVLFFTLTSIKIWYSYFSMTFLLFCATWAGQIIFSARKGTKPPMAYSYIFFVTLFKMFIPFYLKGYPNSIFSFRPNYLKVIILDGVIFIEAIILSLQKLIGPKFFLTKKYKQPKYVYFRKKSDISEADLEQECVICLENIGKIYDEFENEKNNNNDNNNNQNKNEKFNLEKYIINLLSKFQKKHKNEKPFMVTPCHHIFHSRCLELWLEQKNECPYCRAKIPPLEI